MVDASYNKANPFSYGAGHVRPNRAMDPGLVYDLTVNDYLDFLCALGYNQTMIHKFSEGPYECPKHSTDLLSFNYPSITVPHKISSGSNVTVTRKLKNVGSPGKYAARVRGWHGFSITVEPSTLVFEKFGEEKRFKLTLEKSSAKIHGSDHQRVKKGGSYAFGELLWSDGKHYVRSPIVVAA